MKELKKILQNVTFRGLYDARENPIYPYFSNSSAPEVGKEQSDISFRLTTVFPRESINDPLTLHNPEGKPVKLFTTQPTIYQNQTEIIKEVEKFLRTHNISLENLDKIVEYEWEGKGTFHVLPPIIEKHTYYLKNGYLDLDEICQRFKDTYVRDARGNLHNLGDRYLNSFYIDEVSKLDNLDIFNSNAPIINYGLNCTGKYDFYIICDGAHRLDYTVEYLNKPTNVIVVESQWPLFPYYAMPVSFRPTVRLSSKKSEKIYHRLERDKIHIFNDFIKKILHYRWESANLKVSKLRSNVEIY